MDRRYVGIDLHRRRSVIYAMTAEGDKLFCERIDNDSLLPARSRQPGRRRCGGVRNDDTPPVGRATSKRLRSGHREC